MTVRTCSYIESCPIYKYFRREAKRVFTNMYCEGDYHACARYSLRSEGQPVPENLLPHGSKLWPDGENPQQR